MRLAQAARKLSITTEDIVDFLEIRGISIEKDSNTKLGEEAVRMLYKYFEIEEDSKAEELQSVEEIKPESIREINIEETEQEPNENEEEKAKEEIISQKEEKEETSEEEIQTAEESEKVVKRSFKTVDELLETQGEDTGDDLVIKPAKVELKGLNVVGKIDLPEPKPKAEPEQKEEPKVKTKRTFSKTRENKSPKRRQNRELSPSEIRKREEQREARKREQIEKEKKKKREQFYKEKILKPKQIEQKNKPKKSKSLIEETTIDRKPKPKTLLGKFWRWLNT